MQQPNKRLARIHRHGNLGGDEVRVYLGEAVAMATNLTVTLLGVGKPAPQTGRISREGLAAEHTKGTLASRDGHIARILRICMGE